MHKVFMSLLAVVVMHFTGPAAAQIVQWQQLVHSRIDANATTPDRRGVAIDSAGNVFSVASLFTDPAHPNLRTAKYSTVYGTVTWERTFDAGNYTVDEARGIAIDTYDNVIVGAGGEHGARVIKYANDGSDRWNVSLQAHMDDLGHIALDSAGNVYAVGLRENGGASNVRILKLSASNGAVLWDRSYGSAGLATVPSGIAVDSSGSLIVAGMNSGGNVDIVTFKYGSDGTLAWEKSYAGIASGKDWAGSVAVDGSGNALVVGYTINTEGNNDFVTLKYAAANGNLMWAKTFDAAPGSIDIADSIAVDAAGDVYIAGTSTDESQSPALSRLQVIKYAAADGTLVWRQDGYTTTGGTLIATSMVWRSGSLLITATNTRPDITTGYVFKHAAATGVLAWSKATDNEVANSIAVDASGGVVSSGFGYFPGGAYDIKLTKYSSAGADQWRAMPIAAQQPTYSAITHVVVDNSGNLAATGFTRSRPGPFFDNEDFKTVKFDGQTGAVLWERTFAGSAAYPDNPIGIATDSQGNVIVAGIVHDAESGGAGYIKTIKYRASDGEIIWQTSFVGNATFGTRPVGLKLDASGNVVIGGWGYNGSVYELRAVKYSASGALLWQKSLAYAGNTYVNGMTLDPAGNAILTGNTNDAAGAATFKTWKLSGADGGVLWDRSGPTGSGYGVVADNAGNVYAVGPLLLQNTDYVTLKYSADGTAQWQQTFAGTGQGEDLPTAIQWDGNGGVVVTGTSTLVGGETEMRTLKYRTSDGALLWSSAFGGVGNISLARALAIDTSGNVLVAGDSAIAETAEYRKSDMRAVRYNGATGALMWSLGYDGSAPNSRDMAYAVAATGNTFFIGGVSEEAGLPGGMRALRVGSVTDTTPDSFAFAQQDNVPVSTVRVSNAITPGGYDTATQISVSSGEYSIGCTQTFTAASGTLLPGESVCVRHTSSNQPGGTVTTVLTIGGVSGNFRSTTGATTPTPPLGKSDFNGDGRSDILWYNTETGALQAMQTNGFSTSSPALIDQEGDLNWKVVAVADLNGDGRADVVWQHATTGQVYGLLMNGAATLAEGLIYTEPNTQWKVLGAGDFNGDGKADLLWRNAETADLLVQLMDGLTPIGGDLVFRKMSVLWRLEKVADFNGDRKADLLWRNIADGRIHLSLMNGAQVTGGGVVYTEPSADWQIQGAADFNGDGRADILWRNIATGDLSLMQMNGTTILASGIFHNEPLGWKIAATGDYDADGRADILLRHATSGQVRMMLMDGFTIRQTGLVYSEPDARWSIVGQ
jgi:hypothetical protein